MRKSLITITAIVAGLSSLSMYHNPSTDLLDGHDYERMRIDASQVPALSGPLINGDVSWASYSQWLCFPAQNIDIACTETGYGEVRKVPTLQVTQDLHYFEFSMDPEPAPDCDKITDRWKALLQNERRFAYMLPHCRNSI